MDWEIAKDIGYKPKTTFWNDFNKAEINNYPNINDLTEHLFQTNKDNIFNLTELVMILNHRCWAWYEKNYKLFRLYDQLFYDYRDKAFDYIKENMDEDDMNYFISTLD